MNTLVEYEAQELASLFDQGDMLSIRMFMENMHMPLDVQDKICTEISSLRHQEQNEIAKVIESHGQSSIAEKMNY
ncbi:hypothetical protein [Shewanella gelidii]|uniref:Uncharacterized protein n=1 Tax=Shewanella gelidii TaxID=1642821 RepID=A0A917JRY0_9GAMM|nr:hypothetical protein [Shewanella gelidii]MCL1098288.1 hypothetical protein [Shewanella gelidii]GGI84105.1 hypothetical protein GCM10009332_21680 [Shewanella gelidii]